MFFFRINRVLRHSLEHDLQENLNHFFMSEASWKAQPVSNRIKLLAARTLQFAFVLKKSKFHKRLATLEVTEKGRMKLVYFEFYLF